MQSSINIKFTYTGKEKYPPFSTFGDLFKDFQSAFNIIAPIFEIEEEITLFVKSIKSGSIIIELAWEVIKTGVTATVIGLMIKVLQNIARIWDSHRNKKSKEFLEASGFRANFIEFLDIKNLNVRDLTKREVIDKYKDNLTALDPDFQKKVKIYASVNRSSNWKIEIE